MYQDDIEAAGWQPAQTHQVVAGRSDEPPPFARSDAPCGTPEGFGATLTHFDEDHRIAFGTDQIDLAEPTAVVAREQVQARGLEVCPGESFGRFPEPVQGGRAPGPAYSRCGPETPT